MTKKDYNLFAEMLRGLKPKLTKDDFPIIVNKMCQVLQKDNPDFNHKKFLDYIYT